jgi:hypothetical protein
MSFTMGASQAKRDRDVRRACIAAIISGAVTLAVSVFALTTKDGLGVFSRFGFIDAAVIFVLVYWVRRNSRIAISLLILHLIFSKLNQYWRTGNPEFTADPAPQGAVCFAERLFEAWRPTHRKVGRAA